MRLVMAGTAAGLLLASVMSRVLQGFVHRIAVTDTVAFVVATAIAAGTACVAVFVPAIRALKVNVTAALKSR